MRFTVLTATYNRAPYLRALYESLCGQTFRDFEWVIVDDGSTDATKELVRTWKPFFPIKYSWKSNGGKHTALNLGASLVAGEFVMTVDSDDQLLPHTLQTLDRRWREIPNPEAFACLSALCYCSDGVTILGEHLQQDRIDTFSFAAALTVSKADLAGIIRTDVFRQFPFPVFPGERFVPESVVWSKILNRYGSRYFNEPILIKHYTPTGLSNQGRALMWRNARGHLLYFLQMMTTKGPLKNRFKAAGAAGLLAALIAGRSAARLFHRPLTSAG